MTKLVEGEGEKLSHIDELLHQRLIGQDEAVDAVTDAVIRARSGLKDPNRPIGSFIFSVRRVFEKPNSEVRWLSSCSMMKRIWFVSICPNTWQSMLSLA